jgi:hypothetical protein
MWDLAGTRSAINNCLATTVGAFTGPALPDVHISFAAFATSPLCRACSDLNSHVPLLDTNWAGITHSCSVRWLRATKVRIGSMRHFFLCNLAFRVVDSSCTLSRRYQLLDIKPRFNSDPRCTLTIGDRTLDCVCTSVFAVLMVGHLYLATHREASPNTMKFWITRKYNVLGH